MQVKEFIPKPIAGATQAKSQETFQPGFWGAVAKSAPVTQSAATSTPHQAEKTPAAPAVPVAPPVKVYTEQDMATSRVQGFEDGYAKGYHAAKSLTEELDRQIAQAAETIALQLVNISQNVQAADRKSAKDLVQVAVAVAKKLAGHALQAEPLAEVERVIIQSLTTLFNEPKVVVHVHPELLAGLLEKIKHISKQRGFEGDIDIRPDAAIGKGDCRIEWNGGGLNCSKEDIGRQVEKLSADMF